MEKINKKRIVEKAFILGIYVYLVLPFILFVCGWIKVWLALPMLLIVGISVGKAVHDTESVLWLPRLTRDNLVKLIIISICIIIWVYYSGIGARVYQSSDHFCRNGIFEALVNRKWPVCGINGNAGNSGVALIYYIGFWLPSAIVGKLFGLRAGYSFQIIWAFLGIWCMYYLICSSRKKIELWPLILIIFFSGLDIVGQYLLGVNILNMESDAHIEWWMAPYQYSSMTTQLFWVYNQAIAAWLCTVFAREQKNNRSIVFILSTCLLSSTFPFVGLMILTVYWILSKGIRNGMKGVSKKGYNWGFWKNIFTFQNIFGGGVIGIVSFLYLRGNISATKIAADPLVSGSIPWVKYLLFIIIEVGVYLVVLYKYCKNKREYYVVLLSLILIPLFMKNSSDFCMRVSIPALLVMILLIINVLPLMQEQRDWAGIFFLVMFLFIGSVTPLHEMSRAVKMTVGSQSSDGTVDITPTISFERLISGGNFSGPTEGNLFFEHFAKCVYRDQILFMSNANSIMLADRTDDKWRHGYSRENNSLLVEIADGSGAADYKVLAGRLVSNGKQCVRIVGISDEEILDGKRYIELITGVHMTPNEAGNTCLQIAHSEDYNVQVDSPIGNIEGKKILQTLQIKDSGVMYGCEIMLGKYGVEDYVGTVEYEIKDKDGVVLQKAEVKLEQNNKDNEYAAMSFARPIRVQQGEKIGIEVIYHNSDALPLAIYVSEQDCYRNGALYIDDVEMVGKDVGIRLFVSSITGIELADLTDNKWMHGYSKTENCLLLEDADENRAFDYEMLEGQLISNGKQCARIVGVSDEKEIDGKKYVELTTNVYINPSEEGIIHFQVARQKDYNVQADTIVGNIEGKEIFQTLQLEETGLLYGCEIMLGTYGVENYAGTVGYEVIDSDGNTLLESEMELDQIRDNEFSMICFEEPIKVLKGERIGIVITYHNSDALPLALYVSKQDCYENGTLYINNDNKKSKDMVFRLLTS